MTNETETVPTIEITHMNFFNEGMEMCHYYPIQVEYLRERRNELLNATDYCLGVRVWGLGVSIVLPCYCVAMLLHGAAMVLKETGYFVSIVLPCHYIFEYGATCTMVLKATDRYLVPEDGIDENKKK
jgi:hypothetical protein